MVRCHRHRCSHFRGPLSGECLPWTIIGTYLINNSGSGPTTISRGHCLLRMVSSRTSCDADSSVLPRRSCPTLFPTHCVCSRRTARSMTRKLVMSRPLMLSLPSMDSKASLAAVSRRVFLQMVSRVSCSPSSGASSWICTCVIYISYL